MATPANPLGFKIAEAKKGGYSDDEILGYLEKSDPSMAGKMKEARDLGYGSGEVIAFLSGGAKDNLHKQTGFWGRAGENLNPMNLVRAAAHPFETTKALLTPDAEVAKESADAFERGDYGRGALSLAQDVPVFGPPIRQAEKDIKAGDYGALAGTIATAAIPSVLKRVKPKIPIRNNLNPVERSAVTYGIREGVPVDAATASGNKFIRTAQETLDYQPLTSGKVAAAKAKQAPALQGTGRRLADTIHPVPIDPVTAGEAVPTSLTDRVKRLHGVADQSYGELRKIGQQPQNVKPVQIGTKQVPGVNPQATNHPSGMPQTVPVIENMSMPVDYVALKSRVTPVLEQLEKSIPEAQKQASPGLNVLRQIVARGDSVDSNTAIRDLSAIQNIARVWNELPEVRGVSKGLAAMVIPGARKSIDDAVALAGPRATQMLERGRAATKDKYSTNDVLAALPKNATGEFEPARIFKRLTSNDDQSIALLRSVQSVAPKTLPPIARAFTEGLMDDMLYQGDVKRAQSAVRSWHNLGDHTKSILFPDPKIRQNVTDFVNLAEMMTRQANPSGSARFFAAIQSLGSPKAWAVQMLAGRPAVDILFGGSGARAALSGGVPVPLNRVGGVVGATVGIGMADPRPPATRPPQ